MLIILTVNGCGIYKTSYEKEYARLWNEIIRSEAWRKSLLSSGPQTKELYSSADDLPVLLQPELMDNSVNFEKHYGNLVSRAYFKIISQAEIADARIAAEYRLLKDEEKDPATVKDKAFKSRKEMVTKKYMAHREMLSGLKSWNIFSEQRSGDLDYFKKENYDTVYSMMQNGDSTDQVVNFLIYQLANLYHLEE